MGIKFFRCDLINDDGLEQLRSAISALKQLQNYRVDFRGYLMICYHLTNI